MSEECWSIKRGAQWVSTNWKSAKDAKQAARRLVNPHKPDEFEVINETGIGCFRGSFDGQRMKWEKMR